MQEKIINTTVVKETAFISFDGKEWAWRHECQQYEELKSKQNPLENHHFFDRDGNPFDIFNFGDIPPFVYVVVTKTGKPYFPNVIKELLGVKYKSSDESYCLPFKEGIWYNDWSNAYNGASGNNGWTLCDITQTQKLAERYKNEVELLTSIAKKAYDAK